MILISTTIGRLCHEKKSATGLVRCRTAVALVAVKTQRFDREWRKDTTRRHYA